MAEGVDYQSRPGGANLAAAGKRFAVRYLYYPGATKPTLTATEKTDLLNHGIAIALVMEVYGDDCFRGYGWGAQLAQWAKSSASALGLGGLPVYFAVDRDVNVGQRSYAPFHQTAVHEFLRGARSVIGFDRMGVYGGYYVIEWALSNAYARWGWQTYAWSYGRLSPRAHIYQYNNYASVAGVSVDLDRSLKTDFGQYPRPSGAGDIADSPSKPSIPDTSTSYQRITATGDPAPMKFRILIDNGKVAQHKLRAWKPIRNGASVHDKTITRANFNGQLINCVGQIPKEKLPAAEQKYGDVYLCPVNDSGGVLGYVKAVDIRFS